jgi:uncharacterized protein
VSQSSDVTSEPTDSAASSASSSTERLRQLISTLGELLPAQGPITAFVFLNTLQALESIPFDTGLQQGSRIFGAEPYLTEEQYHYKLTQGRIRKTDVESVLDDDLVTSGDDTIASLVSRRELRLAMLTNVVRTGPAEELRWFVAETDALRIMRPEVTLDVRKRFIDRTRRWVMHEYKSQASESAVIDKLMTNFDATTIERWSDATWEAFALHALWAVCEIGEQQAALPIPNTSSLLRHRDVLLKASGEDSDTLVHEVLIRYCAAFTDQGFADWPLPQREQGFFRAFCALYQQQVGPPDRWRWELHQETKRILQNGTTAMESLQESLDILGVVETEWNDYITASLVALKGWAGLIYQLDVRRDRVAFPVPEGSLLEFLAVRFLLERIALSYLARKTLQYTGTLNEMRQRCNGHTENTSPAAVSEQRTFLLFHVAQLFGWSPAKLSALPVEDWRSLLCELEGFHHIERRRLLHAAFERRFRIQALDALSIHAERAPEIVEQPLFQAVFCIDAREESFRRHIEEIHPQAETFGAAGFFVVPMYYRGASDAHFSTLCPIVIRPQHWVTEEVVLTLEEEHLMRAKTRKALGTASHRMHKVSRSAAMGAVLTASFGVLASVPLVARVLFPRLASRIQRTASRLVEAPRITRLRLERQAEKPSPEESGIGFSLEEMATMSERMLRDINLTKNFARIVMFLGHGSFCLNNPHKSAYDCGACSGSAGGPNARALAAFLNDVRVREILKTRGLNIPLDTHFLGGLHNTCDDTVTFFDLDQLPTRFFPDFRATREVLEEACERNAHERCRRFDTAPLSISYEQAHQHVEGRSQDLAQVRPEFGNATNALCFVGRRSRIRGLFLDRRSFLHSYDASTDDADFNILGRILGAVVPVCSGINLQYFFSSIDSPGWGCGTKLPHNITSLLGVMDGYTSDLRPGLPWQGVEIHEALRLLFVIEAPPKAMQLIMQRNATVRNILVNSWAQLSLLDPHSCRVSVFRNGEFEPYTPSAKHLPTAPSSLDWYRGWRDHLAFAQISPYFPSRSTHTL